MPQKPILILQMQRMGDLILTFPLLAWLGVQFAPRPIWMVAEESFFKALMPISPKAVYFPYTAHNLLKNQEYYGIINLSHRPEAAKLAGELKAGWRYGATQNNAGNTTISGLWQVYRSSLVQNNYHNRFHWADLNLLDLFQNLKQLTEAQTPESHAPQSEFKNKSFPNPVWVLPEREPNKSAKIGLFIGASQAEKHPNPEFFASLLTRLLDLGHKPVLLGGPSDKELASAIVNITQTHALNLCAHFSIAELASMLQGLDLLISPDTGPMHLASQVGTPILNLSLGNVNAWETAPSAPNHYIVRSNLSCVGCWECHRNLECHNFFDPIKIAKIAHELVLGREHNLKRLQLKGLSIFKSSRHYSGALKGLYLLEQLNHKTKPHKAQEPINTLETVYIRDAFSVFWQTFFYQHLSQQLNFDSKIEDITFKNTLKTQLAQSNPKLLLKYNQALLKLCRNISSKYKSLQKDELHACKKDWQKYPPFLRPLSSFVELWLENNDFSQKAYQQVLALVQAALL